VLRQSAALLTMVFLAGCGWFGSKDPGQTIPTEFQGAVAADEPRAALVARDILTQGGTAADAAVALAFAMTATLPSRVSLGGGGACLARAGRPREPNVIAIGPINRPAPIQTDAITFLPTPSSNGQVGMPGLLRGLAMVHARYGRLRWEQVVAAGENIARFGAPMSRALARDLAEAGVTFTSPNGQPAKEGDAVAFPELAGTLSVVRSKGAAEFYTGDIGRAYARGLDGAIDEAALRAYVPELSLPRTAELGNDVANFTRTAGGAASVALLAAAEGDRRLRRSDPNERSAAIADAVVKAGLARPGGDDDPGTTGFVVVDKRGGAVACSLTMGHLFGARRAVPQLGVVAAAPVAPDSPAALSVAASLVTNENVVQLIGGAAGGGDAGAPEALVEILVHAVIGEQPVQQAWSTFNARHELPRTPPSSGAVAPTIAQATTPARVNAVVCAGGLPNGPDTCSAQADPRGAGLATLVSAPIAKR